MTIMCSNYNCIDHNYVNKVTKPISFMMNYINPFSPNVPFFYPLKTENLNVF